MLNGIHSMNVQVYYRDFLGQDARAEAFLTTHFSPQNKQIKVTSSTQHARVRITNNQFKYGIFLNLMKFQFTQVGEYFILHVQSNYYLELFNYMIISKGMVLLTGQQNMKATVRTFAIPLSPEMAPAATIVVYNIAPNGDVAADSLTFPVNGISRNNVSFKKLK